MALFIETNRGGKNLHFEGYVYTKIREGDNGLKFWRCQSHKAGCPARATSEGTSVVVRKEHDHPPNPAQTNTQLAIVGMRKRAREESTSINVIYDDNLQTISQQQDSADVLAQLPSLESLRSSLYRARHENTPTLPARRRDVILPSRFTKTTTGEDFLLVDNGGDDKIMIFSTHENLRLMANSEAFYMGGTFSTCPSLFFQVFTIHILLFGHTFPMAYCLLPGKDRHTYNRVLLLLKDAALMIGITFNPCVLISDFELAMVQASTMSFPTANHRGCYYHFMQAIWRKVQALGLVGEYRNPSGDLKGFVQKMAAVAFCPLTYVRTAWLAVQQEAPAIPRVDELVDYFTATWINGNFPPVHWNYFNQYEPRTNNHIEGWHSRMKKVISKPHPNIYSWIEYMQREEAVSKAKITSFRSGATPRPRRRKTKEKEKRIERLFDGFNGGTLTLNEYLDAIKHLTGL